MDNDDMQRHIDNLEQQVSVLEQWLKEAEAQAEESYNLGYWAGRADEACSSDQ